MRTFCFSDLHCDEAAARRLAAAAIGANPAALVSAGDLGVDGVQSPGLYSAFRHVGVPVLAVPGNHDGLAAYPAALAEAGWQNLDDRVVEMGGWVLAGYGQLRLDPRFSGQDAESQEDDPALTAVLEDVECVPASRLILVSHLPPWGTLSSRDRRFIDRGSAQLRRWILLAPVARNALLALEEARASSATQPPPSDSAREEVGLTQGSAMAIS